MLRTRGMCLRGEQVPKKLIGNPQILTARCINSARQNLRFTTQHQRFMWITRRHGFLLEQERFRSSSGLLSQESPCLTTTLSHQ